MTAVVERDLTQTAVEPDCSNQTQTDLSFEFIRVRSEVICVLCACSGLVTTKNSLTKSNHEVSS